MATFLQRSGLICTTFLFTSLVCMHFWRPNFALVLLWWFSSTNFSWWIILIVAFKIRLHLIIYVLLIFSWSCACLKSNFLAIGTQRKIIVAHLPTPPHFQLYILIESWLLLKLQLRSFKLILVWKKTRLLEFHFI